MIDDRVEKIERLIEKFSDPAFPDDRDRLFGIRKQLQESIIAGELKDNIAIKALIKELNDELVQMTHLLLEEKMDAGKRDNILDRRKLYVWFISFFEDADIAIENIMKMVEDETKNLNAGAE